MILKTLKTQLASAGLLAATALVAIPVSAPAAPLESEYCICVAECGGDTACWDWCAIVHMQTLCEAATPEMAKDRR